jgi:hypothetical protein
VQVAAGTWDPEKIHLGFSAIFQTSPRRRLAAVQRTQKLPNPASLLVDGTRPNPAETTLVDGSRSRRSQESLQTRYPCSIDVFLFFFLVFLIAFLLFLLFLLVLG